VILVLSVRDMKMGLGSWNYLARPQSFSNVHEEVVWFDITMIEISPRVGIFDRKDLWQLISKEENGLETKFAVTEVEKILQPSLEEIG